jgi:hypothetical protein
MSTATATLADLAADAFVAGDAAGFVAHCAEDVLLDAVVPTWRFQLGGREALRELLATEEFLPGRRVTVAHRTPTADGVLLEIETWAPLHSEDRMWRETVQIRTAGGAVTEVVVYCSGIWDAATIARQAVEAPMVRPR